MNITSKRILAFIFDLLVLGVLSVVSFLMVGFIIKSLNIDEVTPLYLWSWCMILIFIFRDALGISLGKRLFKICIKSDKKKKDWRLPENFPKETATWQQLFLRNITLVIWPVEALMIITGSKRLGDMLAHTYVTEKTR